MRISDWSSDVCSSDLSNLEIENMVRLSRQRRAIHEIVARGRQRPRTVGVRNGGVTFLHLQLRLSIGIITDQHDPAACEEGRIRPVSKRKILLRLALGPNEVGFRRLGEDALNREAVDNFWLFFYR